MEKKLIPFFIFVVAFVLACQQTTKQKSGQQAADGYVAEYLDSVAEGEKPDFVKAYLAKIQASLAQAQPIMLRTDSIDAKQQLAQEIAVQNPQFAQYAYDPQSRKALRAEIFGIYAARASDLNDQTKAACSDGNCYKVELYNYALNFTTTALVSLTQKAVVGITTLPHTQPDIPPYLKEMALQIAIASPATQQALGFKPETKDALMADTKTALNKTRCERSLHLCVAPTFVKGNKALWTIVDLTDLRLVGLRWTNVGDYTTRQVTERKLQNEKLTECYCKKETPLEKNGWKMDYMLTSSDGLRVSGVSYKGKPFILSAKLVDWHVSYSNTEGFGYSDAVGCPYFSTAAVVAVEGPRVRDMFEGDKKTGFALEQNFFSEGWPNPCNYNYQQRFEFYDDGRFRVTVASVGRGCGNDGTYRPVTRIAFAGNDNTFSEWTGKDWKVWEKEQWQLQQATTPYTPEGYQFKISSAGGGGFYMEPGRGQFKDGGRGDNAYTYLTRSEPGRDEGESDLVTIGPCCNTDYRQGPEKFIEPNPEPTQGKTLVLWYVPQIKNDNTKGREYCWAETYMKDGVYSTKSFPCFSGPMFVPLK